MVWVVQFLVILLVFYFLLDGPVSFLVGQINCEGLGYDQMPMLTGDDGSFSTFWLTFFFLV